MAGTHDGALQAAVTEVENLGFNASDRSAFLPTTPILRGAEAVDAFWNAGRSGATNVPRASAGYILCSIVQLGGVLYILFIAIMVTVFLAFLPFVSFLFQCCFDTSTAVVELVSDGVVTATNTRNKGGGALINRTVAGAQAAGRFNQTAIEAPTRRAAINAYKGARSVYRGAKTAVNNPELAAQQIREGIGVVQGTVKGGIQKADDFVQINERRINRAGAAAVRARNAAQGASQAAVSNFAARSGAFNKAVAERVNPGGARRAAAAAVSAQRRAGVSGDGSVDKPYTSATAAGWDTDAGDWSDAEGPLLKPSAQQRRAKQQQDRAGARTGAIAGAVDALGAFGQRVLRLGVAPRPSRPRTPPESPESP